MHAVQFSPQALPLRMEALVGEPIGPTHLIHAEQRLDAIRQPPFRLYFEDHPQGKGRQKWDSVGLMLGVEVESRCNIRRIGRSSLAIVRRSLKINAIRPKGGANQLVDAGARHDGATVNGLDCHGKLIY